MLNRKVKAAYYTAAGPLMLANATAFRLLRAPRTGTLKVHLGPGQSNYIDGWINVDANFVTAKCDIWADLRNPLPFHDGTVSAVYSHHVVEHLPNIESHFRDVFRCMKSGAVYRVGGPHGDSAIKKFQEGDLTWFGEFPDKRRSIGGRFENFLLCRQEHLSILTKSFLEELLTDAGFTDVRPCLPIKQTHYPDLFQACLSKEWESDFEVPHTLIVEAVKP